LAAPTADAVAKLERDRDAEWAKLRAEPVTVHVPGLAWGDLLAQDAKLTIPGNVMAALVWLLTGIPDDLAEMLAAE
jgi:hypothetical protein